MPESENKLNIVLVGVLEIGNIKLEILKAW
jgi:hypothetical protein